MTKTGQGVKVKEHNVIEEILPKPSTTSLPLIPTSLQKSKIIIREDKRRSKELDIRRWKNDIESETIRN